MLLFRDLLWDWMRIPTKIGSLRVKERSSWNDYNERVVILWEAQINTIK